MEAIPAARVMFQALTINKHSCVIAHTRSGPRIVRRCATHKEAADLAAKYRRGEIPWDDLRGRARLLAGPSQSG